MIKLLETERELAKLEVLIHLYHTVPKGVVMVVERDTPAYDSSVEEVLNVWKQRLGEDWMQDALALPDIEQKVATIARRNSLSLPAAWESYFSGVMLSQI